MSAVVLEPSGGGVDARVSADVGSPQVSSDRRDLFSLVERILKDPRDLDRLLGEPGVVAVVISRLVALSLVGISIFALSLSVVFVSAGVWPTLLPIADWLNGGQTYPIRFVPDANSRAGWIRLVDGSALALLAAYSLGILSAVGVCLPSFYFFGLLAGVRTTMLEVVAHAVKGVATAAVTLCGVLPIYVAIVLGLIVFDVPEPTKSLVLRMGLAVPYLAMLTAVGSMYRGFAGLSERMSEHWRACRECFLRRLLVSWIALYVAVSPVMVHTLWTALTI
jgi:hypothetical protein